MMCLQLGSLLCFLFFKWTRLEHFFKDVRLWPLTSEPRFLNPWTSTMILFTCQFLLMIFANGLRFNYLLWYFISLPMLIEQVDTTMNWKVWLFFAIDATWSMNIYFNLMQHSLSSVLQIVHMIILYHLWYSTDYSAVY